MNFRTALLVFTISPLLSLQPASAQLMDGIHELSIYGGFGAGDDPSGNALLPDPGVSQFGGEVAITEQWRVGLDIYTVSDDAFIQTSTTSFNADTSLSFTEVFGRFRYAVTDSVAVSPILGWGTYSPNVTVDNATRLVFEDESGPIFGGMVEFDLPVVPVTLLGRYVSQGHMDEITVFDTSYYDLGGRVGLPITEFDIEGTLNYREFESGFSSFHAGLRLSFQ